MPEKGEDEMATLARSFNEMADSLQDQIHRMEELSTLQRRFVSDVSHELRTPLTTIRMAGEVIHASRDGFDPASKRSAELLQTQLDRFEDLLADLLEISRFDAGAAVLDAEGRDVRDVVIQAVDHAAPLAERRGAWLHVVVPEERCVADIDPRRVERILRNLLVNAVEHAEGSTVEVTVGADAHAVAVTVRDRGVGMTPDEAAHVFDRFWRADPARARTTGGTGLGLAISLEDAHLHGGWLEAWGRPGRGASFRLTLPRRAGIRLSASPLPLQPVESPITGSLRVVARPHNDPAALPEMGSDHLEHHAVRRRTAGGPMSGSRVRRAVVALGTVAVLAACTAIPTSGPVEEGDIEVTEPSEIDVLAEGPQPGDTPAEIVDGFLAAGAAGSTDNFATAREYLAGEAKASWDPPAGVVVSGPIEPAPATTETEVTMDVAVEARVGENGRVRRGAAGRQRARHVRDGQERRRRVADRGAAARSDPPGGGLHAPLPTGVAVLPLAGPEVPRPGGALVPDEEPQHVDRPRAARRAVRLAAGRGRDGRARRRRAQPGSRARRRGGCGGGHAGAGAGGDPRRP